MACLSIRRNCATKATPGIKNTIAVVATNAIDDFPDLKTTLLAGDASTLDGDIELLVGESWVEIEIDPETGSTTFLFEGQSGSGGWDNKIMGQVSGNAASVSDFARCIQSPCGFIAVVKKKDGTVRVIGNVDEPLFFNKWEEVSGMTIKDKAYSSFEAMAAQGNPPPFYEGVITPII
jgi:hypothetical protein